MIQTTRAAAALILLLLPPAAMAQQFAASSRYKALKCPAPTSGTTWTIATRDGAGREVEPYLSSLGLGESGTGVAASPVFAIAGDKITFTLCGHDGSGGGRGENYLALVDARQGEVLRKTEAPGSDKLQERSWEVGPLAGVEARIEIHDGNSASAYAWIGVSQISAGEALSVDFRQGIPDGWSRSEVTAAVREEQVFGGIPFLRNAAAYTLIPKSGALEIPCGFAARRLYFLGCTVGSGKPLTTYGKIEIHYQDGPPDVFPLMCGFTLDGQQKLLSRSAAIHLHASSNPFQHYLVIAPRDKPIQAIRLAVEPGAGSVPRITAITCEAAAENDRLVPLPETSLSAEEAAWIAAHTLSADSPKLDRIVEEIRRSHGISP